MAFCPSSRSAMANPRRPREAGCPFFDRSCSEAGQRAARGRCDRLRPRTSAPAPDIGDGIDLKRKPRSELRGIEHFDLTFETSRTDAVGELGGAAGRNVGFHLMPIILVVANFFAVNADGEQSLQ